MHGVKAGGRFSQTLLITLALLSLYFIWGSTYFAMRVAIDSFPPFMMAALRFSIAGALLYGALRLYGRPAPAAREWLGATAVGVLLLAVGNAGVAYAEKRCPPALPRWPSLPCRCGWRFSPACGASGRGGANGWA